MEKLNSPFIDSYIPKYSVNELLEQLSKGKSLSYVFFWEASKAELSIGWFSQFQYSPFTVDDYEYSFAEQYMMAQKALVFNDKEVYDKILLAKDPMEIKGLGRQVKNFSETEWKKIRYNIVLNGNYYKFMQNKEMMQILLSTEDKILVEASPYDKIWGIGIDESNKKITDPNNWQGQNLFGFALMEVRDKINKIMEYNDTALNKR